MQWYAIGFKTDKMYYSNYILNYSNSNEMILDCIKKMLINENHNVKFYAHNMSEFDGLIILKALINTSNEHKFKISISTDNDGKLISIDIIKYLKNKKIIKISILDSYKLLPVNLRKLANVFNCEVNKDIFPYYFLNKNTLNYKGIVPSLNYFDKSLTNSEYILYKNRYLDSC